MLDSFWTWDGWNALVAIGTLLLAFGTGWLALMTRRATSESARQIDLSAREVEAVERQTAALAEQTGAVREQSEATHRQVEISAASLEAAARPVLVGIAPSPGSGGLREQVEYRQGPTLDIEIERIHYEATETMVYCSVPLRNVGAGVAFIQRVSMLSGAVAGRVSHVVVPPGGLTRARFSALRHQSDGRATAANAIPAESGRGYVEFTIYVVYSGASADLVTGSEVTVRHVSGSEYLVTRNDIFDGDTGERRRLVASADVG